MFASEIETNLNDCLSSGNDFSLQEKPKSLFELEQDEEEKLSETISRLEYSLKHKDRAEFVENIIKLRSEHDKDSPSKTSFKFTVPKRTTSFDTAEGIDLSRSNVSSFLENCSTQSSSSFHQIISQNVEVVDNKIKLMALGDKGVGKSLFVDKFISKDAVLSYLPTENMEVKHHTMNLLGKLVKFDLWDTCVNVLSSPIIKTYFNICDGFVIICNLNNINSMAFMENQIEIILNGRLNMEGVNIFAIVNEERKQSNLINNYVEYLSNLNLLLTRKYNIKLHFMDLSQLDLSSNNNLEKFLINISLKKNSTSRHRKLNSIANSAVKRENMKGTVKQLNLSLRDISSK